MSPYFEQIERDLVEAAARRARRPVPLRRRSRPALALAAALALAVGASAAGATYYVLRASPIAPFPPADVTAPQTVESGTSHVVSVRSADPDRGRLPWTLRLSRSKTGLLCGTVGQRDRSQFGLVGLDDRFRELPEANADACGQESPRGVSLIGVRVFSGRRDRDVRTVVYGVAAGLARVQVGVAGQPDRTLRASSDGAFVLALRGYPGNAVRIPPSGASFSR